MPWTWAPNLTRRSDNRGSFGSVMVAVLLVAKISAVGWWWPTGLAAASGARPAAIANTAQRDEDGPS